MRGTSHLEQFRINHPALGRGAGNEGYFRLRCPATGRTLDCMSSAGAGWDHVSVSIYGDKWEIPVWLEMKWARRLFFEPEEAVMQLHPPVADYESGYVPVQALHLWRPQEAEMMPPREAV